MSSTDISSIPGASAVRPDLRPDPREAVNNAARPALPAADAADQSAVKVEASVSITTEVAPVNNERVAEIRAAIKSGNYPLMPAQIADAMIAAPFLLSAQSE